MEWKKEYELGVDEIDEQHKELIQIINKYKTTISDKSLNSFTEIGKIVVYLIDYTSSHFEAEEYLMLRIGYPDIEAHKKKHRELISKLRDILIKMKNKKAYTPIEFYYFLMAWLNNHILHDDKKISDFSKKNHSNTIPQKIRMDDYDSVIKIIKPNLKKLDILYEKKIIDQKDKELRRSIFLQEFYNHYALKDVDSYCNVVRSINLLLDTKLIKINEKNELCKYLSLN